MIQSTPVMPETLPAPRRAGRLRRAAARVARRVLEAYSRGDQHPPSGGPGPAPRRPAGAPTRSAPLRFAPLAIVALAPSAWARSWALRHEPARGRGRAPWATAWERGDYPAMHALLSERARSRASLKRFVRTYRQAAETATLSEVRAAEPSRRDDDTATTCRSGCRRGSSGALSGRVAPADDRGGGRRGRRLALARSCSPACAAASGCSARRRWPRAARSCARDGTPLAKGPDRLSDLGPLAAEVAGRVGPAPPERAAELARRGVPEGAPVGLNGLEREFDERLSGTPGRHPARRRARRRPRRAARRRRRARRRSTPTSSAPRSRRSPGRFGGIAVLRPATGEVLGLSGIAFSAPQPPGSTFKIITLAGALEARRRQAGGQVPGPDRGHARGRRAPERPRRVLRRHAAAVLRGLLQLRLRPAGRQARGQAARRAPPSASASTRTPARAARRARRSRRPRRSATTSRSARPRSARARCSPPRSSWPPWRRRSACAAAASPRRSRAAARARRRAPTAPAPRASSPASCARS